MTCIFCDIDHLLPELADLEHSQAGPRSPRSGSPAGTDTSRLPFGIIIDDPDEPADALTVDGIQAWALLWARTFTSCAQPATALDILHVAFCQQDGAGHPDGDLILEEAHRVHARLARRTGHAPATAGHCWCGGTLWRETSNVGLTDWMVCDGPGEHWYADAQDWARACHERAREVREEGVYWVRRAALRVIWPGLDRRTLHSWVQRGHVTVSGGCYDLAQVNRCMAAMATARVASPVPVADNPSTAATFPSRAIAPEVASSSVPGGGPSTTAGTTATDGQSTPK